MLIVPSAHPRASCVPLGFQQTHVVKVVSLTKARGFSVIPHSLTVPSPLEDARRDPSGLQEMELTILSWPWKTRTSLFLARSQTCTVRSLESAQASCLPSGFHASRSADCPSRCKGAVFS